LAVATMGFLNPFLRGFSGNAPNVNRPTFVNA